MGLLESVLTPFGAIPDSVMYERQSKQTRALPSVVHMVVTFCIINIILLSCTLNTAL
jgi:hypothetical protein